MKQEAPTNLLKSFLLFLIALILLVTTTPIGFVYTLVRHILVARVKSLSNYFVEVAIALDIAGNVMMQHVLNDGLLIKNADTYYFGNKKETISSVIGKNSITGTLNGAGKTLNAFLNLIDKNHAYNSIMYDVRIWSQKRA